MTLKNWQRTKPGSRPLGNTWLACAHLGSAERKHVFNLLSCLLMWKFGGAQRQNPGFMFQGAISTRVPSVWDSLESYIQLSHLCVAGLKKYS